MAEKKDTTVAGSSESRYDFRDSTVSAALQHQRAHPEAHKEAHTLQSTQAKAQAHPQPHGRKTKDHPSEKHSPHRSGNKTKPEHAAVHLATGNEENLEHPVHPEHHEQSS